MAKTDVAADLPRRIAFLVSGKCEPGRLGPRRDIEHLEPLLRDEEVGQCVCHTLYDCPNECDYLAALGTVTQSWNTHDQLILYYAGHGTTDQQLRQWCFAFGESEEDRRRNKLVFQWVLDKLRMNGVTRAVIILDACYAGEAIDLSRSEEGQVRQTLPQGLAFIAAAGRLQRAYDNPNDCGGVFTTILCRAIETGLDGRATYGGVIGVQDFINYINEHKGLEQQARHTVNYADKSIWLARNKSGEKQTPPAVVPTSDNPSRSSEEWDFIARHTDALDKPCESATLDDLDWDLVHEFAEAAGAPWDANDSPHQQARKLLLVAGLPSAELMPPKRIAVICFAKSPHNFVEGAECQIFYGDIAEPNVIKEPITGPISQQIIRGTKRVVQGLRDVASFHEPRREETKEISEELVRELLSNALIHRDYESPSSVDIRVTADELVVTSPGSFHEPPGWDDYLRVQLPSKPPNPKLIRFMKALGVFEKFGRGFQVFKKFIERNGPDSISCVTVAGPATRITVKRPRIGGEGDTRVKRSPQPADPTAYLQDLAAQTGFIDIRGLHSGKGKSYRFPIDEVFISLTTTDIPEREKLEGRDQQQRRGASDLERRPAYDRAIPLEETLKYDRLVVTGDPGSGKTTFLRCVAHTLCDARLNPNSHVAENRLTAREWTFPVFVRISDLAQHLQRQNDQPVAPAGDEPSAWLPQYLGALSKANSWGLDQDFFRGQLEEGSTVLLDGLDEAPDRVARERMSRLVENVTRTFSRSRFVITSRPAAYTGGVVLPDFAHVRIDALSDAAVEIFLARWSAAAYRENEREAREHCGELLSAVRGRPEIRRMARNPVMLTALAVVHWNERRLPEQRADLYHSIITWLSRSRELRPGRETADRTAVLLSELALAMQNHPEERKTQVPRHWAAEQIAAKFGGKRTKDSIARAEAFLAEEEVDSGILVGRGNDVSFWHLTFQEFLAAKGIAAELDEEQRKILFTDPNRIYQPEWREVVLLLLGILHEHGQAKVDGFVRAAIDQLGNSADLAQEARCVGLLGCVVRDLAPLEYQITDPRYARLLQGVMGIFDSRWFKKVPIETRIAAADAVGQAGDPRFELGAPGYWVSFSRTSFLMGTQKRDPRQPNYDEEGFDRESPVHEVALSSFKIGRYPVTVGEYRRFVEAGGYADQRHWRAGGFDEYSQPQSWEDQLIYSSRPVTGVSWYEASAYAGWSGCRLATEAEWEFAARGTDGRKYPWGNAPADELRLNFRRNIGHPTPVGVYSIGGTPEGIQDMAGNVWEWCSDQFEDYSAKSITDPTGTGFGEMRVYRGGCWIFAGRRCRSAFRYAGEPSIRHNNLGFRVAADS